MKPVDRIKTISERLKEYRTSKGLTLADMEKITGIPAQTINRYELGQRAPKIDVAVSIAESLSINPLWLQGYNVPIESEKPTIVSDDGLSDSEQQLIKLFRLVPPEDRGTVAGMIEGVLRHKGLLK